MGRALISTASTRVTVGALFACIPALVFAADPIVIDVFTTTDRPVAMPAAVALAGVAINVVEVDTLERFNASLSEGLSADPNTAQTAVKKRLSTLQQDKMTALQRTAIGLAAATQLGVDRTPAIVFNKEAVIYGLTDLTEALRHYRAWRRTSG